MFKRSLALAALSATMLSSAFAADLPVKALPFTPAPYVCVPGMCSGWYAGFGVIGDGTNADIVGNGINGSVFAAGGAIKVQGGYQFWSGSLFAAIEGSVGYEFTTAASSAIAQSQGSRFVGHELVKLGYNFFPSTQGAVTVPGQSPVSLPVAANLLASSTPYFVMGGVQRHGKSLWANGAGVETSIAKGWTTSVDYLYAAPQQGEAADSTVMLSLNKHF